ncbi:EAL domain-containing protein [Vibrio sp. HN007]|uniref:bifunctional diguanylate cyclase/phosphodiesterase n=1 Tax=Vibrio iocasae TaxID=3098914 RepID=UPI0035D3F840
MAVIKRNIWSLFWLIIFSGTMLFTYSANYLWERTNEKFLQLQYVEVDQFANSTQAFLKSQESLLEVLGNQLSLDSSIPHSPEHSPVLERVRKTHPAVAGLGLANLKGDLVAVSYNLNLEKLPNLLQQEASRDSFLQTMESTRLVVGRTYLLDSLEDAAMAMAIRRAIRNESDELVSVMTAGIKVNQSAFLAKTPDYQRLDIIRDDGYLQFSSAYSENKKVYETPIPQSTLQDIINSAVAQNNVDKSSIQSSMRPYPVDATVGGIDYNMVIRYDPYFQFWTASRIEDSYIRSQFYHELVAVTSLYLGSCLVFFMLAGSIARSEKEKLEELHYQAFHDVLTGLPNQHHLREMIDDKRSSSISIVYINIDRMKSVNDAYGQSYGDKLLVDIAKRLEFFAKGDMEIARGVGDEFYLLCPEKSDSEIETFCSDILSALSAPFAIQKMNFLITASLSVASSSRHGSNVDELLRSLDIAMTEAKKTRNTTCFVTPDLQRRHFAHLQIEQRLKGAITHNKLHMVYQPQIDQSGGMYGAEALVRWIDDELGFVPPDKFIPIAEKSGLMPQLGFLIVENALRDTAQIRKKHKKDFTLSLNISVMQLLQSNFGSFILHQLKRFEVPAESIILEITESVFIEDLQQIRTTCVTLIEHGIRFSLDDFGTGYSSLSLISNLPLSELKIDKSFVDGIETNQQSRLMVSNILDIANNHNMAVVAEGVETESQKQILSQSGCGHFQGYFFSKPIGVEELGDYLSKESLTV